MRSWKKELADCKKGLCLACCCMQAELVNDMGAYLRNLNRKQLATSRQAKVWTFPERFAWQEIFTTPRDRNPRDFVLPNLYVSQGQKTGLEVERTWEICPHDDSGANKRRPAGEKFLSTFVTASMQSAYPDGIWYREFTTVPLPDSFGEQNIKRGACQDAARAAANPQEIVDFGDHMKFRTDMIYLVR